MKTQEVQIKDRYGNLSSMFYDPYTDPEVAVIIEQNLYSGRRLRVFYGDTDAPDFEEIHRRRPDPGMCWDDEYNVTGTIGRSTGPKAIPLMINNSCSMGGPAILTGCIVRILINGREVYRHPNYHSDYDHARGHLLQNAQEAPDKQGRVTVRLRRDDGWAVIEIEDTGCGMDAEFIRERLFKPFDSTKGLTGMGIGAYESREFIRSLGGEIRVQSKPGAGSIFRVVLPCIDGQGI